MRRKRILKSSHCAFWGLTLMLVSGQLPAKGFEVVSHFRLNSSELRAFEEGGANHNRIEVGPSGEVYVGFSGVLRGKRVTDVFFRRFLPDEDRWDELVRLSEEDLLNRAPAIWVGREGKIHYAWLAHERSGESERVGLRYRGSEDGGGSWSDVHKLDAGIVVSRVPVLQGDEQGNLYLCISNQRNREDQERIILFRSGDRGESWEQVDVHNGEERVASVNRPRLVAGEEGKAYLTWLDPTPGGRAVVFSQTEDGGKSWSEAIALNDDLTRILSDPVVQLDHDRIQVSWLETGGRKSSIYVDSSDDGGKSWQADRLLYQEPVSRVTLKSAQVRDTLLVSWSDYRELLWQRGERLLYRLHPQDRSGGDADSSMKQSLTGSLDNLLSFRGFEVVPFGSDGCVAVYSKKTLEGKPKIYVSWSQKLIEGFEEVLAVSQDDGTKESLWPRVRQVSDNELFILYNQFEAIAIPGQNRRKSLGNLILTRVRLRESASRSGSKQPE